MTTYTKVCKRHRSTRRMPGGKMGGVRTAPSRTAFLCLVVCACSPPFRGSMAFQSAVVGVGGTAIRRRCESTSTSGVAGAIVMIPAPHQPQSRPHHQPASHGRLRSSSYSGTTTNTALHYLTTRDADMMEMMAGGARYEMVQLPDSMVETTLFVGNLCEFVTDDDLSALFAGVSKLNSVPSCVVRKPNAASLKYGFVTFPSVEEKEAAIIRFHGHVLNGRPIKVETIKDEKSCGRVRVPEKIVLYAVGSIKKTRNGQTNALRRIDRDDVERLKNQRGGGGPSSSSKKKGGGSSNKRDVVSSQRRLSGRERGEFDRAAKRGYVILESTGYRRGRKGSPLANLHRQWCDAREKPQIVLCKASGGRPLDNVIVDLSPLRIGALSDDMTLVDDFLTKWKTEILIAAENTGMGLKTNYEEDNCESLGPGDDLPMDDDATTNEFVFMVDPRAASWANDPICTLPSISMGVFEGERSKAKAMARELATLWDVMDADHVAEDSSASGALKSKRKRYARERRGGRLKYKNHSGRRERRSRREKDVWYE